MSAVGILLSIAIVAVVFGVPLFVTNDGPQGTFQAYVEAHIGDPSSVLARQFELGVGLGGRGHHLVYRAVASVFSFPRAYAITQALHALFMAASVGALVRAVARRTTPFVLGGAALAFGWSYFMGFFPFVVGLAASLAIAALGLSSPRPSFVRRALVSGLFALDLVLGHPVAAAVGLVVWSAVVLSRAYGESHLEERPSRLQAALVWVGSTMLPFVVVYVLLGTAVDELSTVKEAPALFTWPTLREWLATTPRMALPGGGVGGWIVIAAAGAVLARGVRTRDATIRAVAASGVAFLVLALAGPMHVPGWQYFAPRFYVPAFALALATASTTLSRPAAWIAPLALSIAALGAARRASTHYATACHDAIDGLLHVVPRHGVQLPILFDSMCGLPIDPAGNVVPHLQPALHLHALFAVAHGGSVPFVFAGAPIVHLLTIRSPTPVPIPPLDLWGLAEGGPVTGVRSRRHRALDRLLALGVDYDNILLFGATGPDRVDALARGYVPDFDEGRFLNAHLDPCVVDVVVPVRPHDPPVLVAGGAEGVLWPTTYDRRGDELHASFRGLCGPVSAIVTWAAPGPACKGADPKGLLSVSATQGETTVVRCEREP